MFATSAPPARVVRAAWLGVLLAVMLVGVDAGPAGASAPDDVPVIRDVSYGSSQDDELRLDVYRPPAATSPSPILVLIHGGGWTRGDKQQFEPFARSLAVAGFVVFDINYSLDASTSPGYPRQVDDVRTALAWVLDHAEGYGGDIGRIGVAGGSAGGYLAAMLGTQANTGSSTPVRAVVSLSGPMDLVDLVADLRRATASGSERCAPLGCAAVQEASDSLRSLLGCDPLQCPEELLREASPVTHVTSASPPFFLANGTAENVPATQATRMATALRSEGVPVDLHLVPGGGHSVDYVAEVSGSLLDFLTEHVAADPPTADPTATEPAPAGDADQSQDAGGRGGHLRWLVVAAALGLLAAIVAVRRRHSAEPDTHGTDLLGVPGDLDRS